MSLALDPFVQNKLDEFITRRRRWTIIQATLIGLAVWLVGILLFTWAMPFGYWIALSAWCLSCSFTSLLPSRCRFGFDTVPAADAVHKAAIEIERGDPRFRDQLLSTVELVRGDHDVRSHSFIAASQTRHCTEDARV